MGEGAYGNPERRSRPTEARPADVDYRGGSAPMAPVTLARPDQFVSSRVSIAALLQLQRAAGNRSVTRLIQRTPDRHAPAKTSQHKKSKAPAPFADPKHDPHRSGSASGETPTTLENTIGRKIGDWRAAADRGVARFATAAVENAINNRDIDGQALAAGFGGNVVWALTAFTSKAMPLLNFGVSVAGIFIASTPGMHGQHDNRTPIEKTRAAIDHILDELQDRQGQAVRQFLKDEMREDPTVSVDEIVDDVLRDLFDDRVLVVHPGGQTGIKAELVEDEIEAKARDLYERFIVEVNPIGQGEWGHATDVLIQISGGRHNGREALAERKISDDGHETYWWKYWIDEDLRAAAEARANAINDVLTVVSEKNVDNIDDLGNLAWPRAEPRLPEPP